MFYFIILPLLLLLAYKFLYSNTHRFNLPPSPPSIPIIGHLHLMRPPIHRLLQRYSKKLGPIFSLRFGSRRVIVISSSSLAQESFTGQNDLILSSRPLQLTAKYVAYNHTTVGTAPYGDHWRNLRKICSQEILSSHRLINFLHIRKDEILRMLTRLSRDTLSDGSRFTHVELEPLLSDLTFNNIVRMVTGKRYYGDEVNNKEEAELFKKLVYDIAVYSGANHSADYLPILKLFGNKFEKEVKAIGKSMDDILQRLLDECSIDKENSTSRHSSSATEPISQPISQPNNKGFKPAKATVKKAYISTTLNKHDMEKDKMAEGIPLDNSFGIFSNLDS